MKNGMKRIPALLLSLLLLGSVLSVAGAAVDTAAQDGDTLTMAMQFYRKDPEGNWVATDRAKPGEALKLRFFAATEFATNNFDLGFAYDRQFFTNSMANDSICTALSVNPALTVLEDYTYVCPSQAKKATNAKLQRLLQDGRLTQTALEENDYVIGSVEWQLHAVNTALPADTWIFELDSFAVADNDYVRTAGQTGVLEVPAALGLDASAGLSGLYSFPKGDAGAEPTGNVLPGNGWTPVVTSTPAEISVFSKLILDANGGGFGDQPTSTLTGVIGEKVTGLVDMDGLPTRKGFAFAGFARTQDGTALSNEELAALTYDYEDQTLYALWTPKPITYTFDAGDGAFENGAKTIEAYYAQGETPAAPSETPSLPGFRFLDWDNELPAQAQGDLTFTALYEPLSCTVRFLSANGDELDSTTVDGGTQIEAIDLPEGYKPDGWTDGAGNAVAFPYTVTGDVDLSAPADGNVYNAYFYVDDVLYATTQNVYEEQIAVPEDPDIKGGTFLMWDPDPDGIQDTEELRFDAVYELNDYTVYYYYNNSPAGVVDPDPAEGLHTGEEVPLPAHPEVPGYQVTDWELTDDDGVLDEAVIGESDVYATADWSAIPYQVTYVYSGEVPDGAQPPQAVTAYIGDEIALPVPAAVAGYVFEGWTLSGDADGKVDTQDVTATGVWKQQTYRVMYAFDGQIPPSAELPQDVFAHTGDAIELPEIVAPEGYSFLGWTLEDDDNGKVGTKPVTAVGSWAIHTHTATFLDDAGATVSAETYAYGAPVPAPQAPARIGFCFVDWYSETAGVWTEATVMGDADLVFTARYASFAYTVTYLADGETAATQTVPAGAATDAPAYTAPEGYGLRFWADADGNAVKFPFTPTADTTLNAVLDRAQNGVFYSKKGQDEIEITGLEFGRTAADIPAEINGKPVTAIADGAFAGNESMTSVSIPESVTQIGKDAFDGCTALKDATYAGTQEEWDDIVIDSGNDPLLDAALHCHVHDYTATVTREATCKQTGERLWVCSGCGDSYTEEIPLADHVHGYWVLDLDRRVNEEICTVCGLVLATEPYEEPPIEEKTPTVKIKNNPGTTQLPYRYSLMLTAEATDLGKGQAIAWYLDGVLLRIEPTGETTARVKLDELREDVTVTVKIVDAESGVPVTDEDGNEVADQETVQVRNGFFARVIGFFRALFGRLKIVEQAIKFVL
ncbi:MAG: InlB B-repeat-containing protein [Clostridia bacterium]|nr:InlB B-repeat-containing protein [Clostridia bacterium]